MKKDELINGIRRGGPSALQKLYDLYFDDLVKGGMTWLANKSEAEDVVQDVMIRLIDLIHSDRFRVKNNEERLKYFLQKCVGNQCFDLLRKKEPDCISIEDDSSNQVLVEQNTPYVCLENKELRERIVTEAERLLERQRIVLLLSVLEEYSNPEIAKKLRISTNQVKKLLSLAKKAIRPKLEEYLK